MLFHFESRASESPLVEGIWRTQSGRPGQFISLAQSRWSICVWKQKDTTTFTVRGPETRATQAECPADSEFFGIVFRLGTVMPNLPASGMVNADLDLPPAGRSSFWLHGVPWQLPNYDNADTFVDWLAREGELVRQPLVGAALRGERKDPPSRTLQRHFIRTIGLTQSAVRQIERARRAMTMLKRGASIIDAVVGAGYSDQSHLTRSLHHFMGQTPAQLNGSKSTAQLGFFLETEL
jgi:hypothetical protein